MAFVLKNFMYLADRNTTSKLAISRYFHETDTLDDMRVPGYFPLSGMANASAGNIVFIYASDTSSVFEVKSIQKTYIEVAVVSWISNGGLLTPLTLNASIPDLVVKYGLSEADADAIRQWAIDIPVLRTDINANRADISKIETNLSQIETDLSTVETDLSNIRKDMGDISTLNTTAKDTLVNAINEANTPKVLVPVLLTLTPSTGVVIDPISKAYWIKELQRVSMFVQFTIPNTIVADAVVFTVPDLTEQPTEKSYIDGILSQNYTGAEVPIFYFNDSDKTIRALNDWTTAGASATYNLIISGTWMLKTPGGVSAGGSGGTGGGSVTVPPHDSLVGVSTGDIIGEATANDGKRYHLTNSGFDRLNKKIVDVGDTTTLTTTVKTDLVSAVNEVNSKVSAIDILDSVETDTGRKLFGKPIYVYAKAITFGNVIPPIRNLNIDVLINVNGYIVSKQNDAKIPLLNAFDEADRKYSVAFIGTMFKFAYNGTDANLLGQPAVVIVEYTKN